ncbi:MAG: hypothetical protein R6V62_10315 [Candidatus Fermentibacteraceae bacterium]
MNVRNPALPLLLILGLFLTAFALMLPPDSFWCMDEANRFLQTHALTLNRATLPPELPYPGRELITDPALLERLRPLPAQYGFMREGRLYSQYTPILAVIALPFYMLFGPFGIYIPPLAGGLALALVLAGVLRSRGVSSRTSLLLAILATPIPFYSLTFFSHSIALFLTLESMLLLRRGRIIPAFILAAMAVFMRIEMVFALPLLLQQTGKPKIRKMVLAAVLSMALFLILQKVFTGSWLGTHLVSSGTQSAIYGSSGTWLENRLTIIRRAFINAMPGFGVDGLIVGLVIWGLWGYSRIREGTRSGNAAVYAGLLLTLVPIAALFIRGLRSTDTMDVQNPLLAFPLLWLAAPGRKLLGAAAVLTAAMVFSMSPMHTEDVAWGFRHGMLFCFVLCLTLSPRMQKGLVRSVVVVGTLATLTSLSLLAAKRIRGAELTGMVESGGGPVITTSWEQPQEFSPLMADGTPVLHASTTHDLFSALLIFGSSEPLVIVRRESIGLLFTVLEAADMRYDPLGTGPSQDPVTDVVVFRCR